MIDEPSSYLDVRQRLKAAEVRGGGASAARGCPAPALPPRSPPHPTGHPLAALRHQVCHCGGARPVRARLPLRLYLLPLRQAQRVW